MNLLVTGACGFVGGHLTAALRQAGHEVTGTSLHDGRPGLVTIDLREAGPVRSLLERTRPQGIIHLAGLAHVPSNESDLALAVSTNVGATAVLLDEAARLLPGCRLLYVSSGEIYGRRQGPEPIPEETPPEPTTSYSITKLAAEQLALHVGRTRGLAVIVARPFNHLGPGQSELFVAPAFARQLAEIEADRRAPVVRVGNLEARRDFTDVRDVVAAYLALIERGEPGEVYNVCSGQAVSVRQVLDLLLELTRAEVAVEVDPERLRPSDLPVFVGAPDKLQTRTGWRPRIALRQTLGDVLDDWRARVGRDCA